MRPLYIFDLDGTLALIDHRRHILDEDTPDKWDRFYAACVHDEPNIPVINLMHDLYTRGADIWIFSGRSDAVRDVTANWLVEHTMFSHAQLSSPMLQMRHANDYTVDDVLKRQWYDSMLPEDQQRLQIVFDDRDRVVAMWRSLGVTCLQVAPGNF